MGNPRLIPVFTDADSTRSLRQIPCTTSSSGESDLIEIFWIESLLLQADEDTRSFAPRQGLRNEPKVVEPWQPDWAGSREESACTTLAKATTRTHSQCDPSQFVPAGNPTSTERVPLAAVIGQTTQRTSHVFVVLAVTGMISRIERWSCTVSSHCAFTRHFTAPAAKTTNRLYHRHVLLIIIPDG